MACASWHLVIQLRLRCSQIAEGDRPEVLRLVLGQTQPQVIDAGGGRDRQVGRLDDRLRYLAVDVTPKHERKCLTHRAALPVHLQPAEVLRIEAQLHLAEGEGIINLIAIASQRHGCGARHAPTHGPAERLAEQRWFNQTWWTLAEKPLDRRLARFSVDACIAYLLDPGQEPIIELAEAGDAVRFGLQQEPLADEAICALNLAPALRSERSAVHESDTEHRTGPLEGCRNVRAPIIGVEDFWQAAALDGSPQHLLASGRVLG